MRHNLGRALLHGGDPQAIVELRRAVAAARDKPRFPARALAQVHEDLARARAQAGEAEASREHALEASRLRKAATRSEPLPR